MSFDIEKMSKLPPGARFLDINDFWYFPNRWVVKFLYPLPITPTHITIISLIAGLVSVRFYMIDTSAGLMWGALFLYLKIFLDNVDGNLARVRGETSRLGRFLDSLTDFMVGFLVYLVLTLRLVDETNNSLYWCLGGLAFLSCLMQCSYFVYYLVKYTAISGTYLYNRVDEDITEEENEAYDRGDLSMLVYFLHRAHILLYGWQDKTIEWFDRLSKRLGSKKPQKLSEKNWYGDKVFLTLISPLCLCTNNMLLVFFSLADEIELGLWFVVIVGNACLLILQIWKIVKAKKNLVFGG
ncbi:MAG: CDP-alcohol phosphatidyltransferase family protein [Nitrospina sp.]|mgnify:FL=1|jgi:phosphatidylglycerophosphate synthase|nr:CDP-alcohol phosphatidyltransferase family protein [Nitrospina sp.]MBT4128296.1 CDP-alcohol phosphatidyltransferase family protein [Nitrospina sp.]MBT4260775.1 CDP-alcohol phosphatidyltransferase family protein [Nitrospina sp.]MBT7272898.1 CDP-alcohol phosphatidyltransferase family protein [Nitrospina sp.]